jgi:hypothetical protein
MREKSKYVTLYGQRVHTISVKGLANAVTTENTKTTEEESYIGMETKGGAPNNCRIAVPIPDGSIRVLNCIQSR